MKNRCMLMDHIFLKFSIVLSLLFVHASFVAMIQEPDKKITFQGESKYLMHLLLQSEFDNKNNKSHPFAQTRFVRMDNDRYVKGGTILNLTDNDYQQIKEEKYIYLDDYFKRNCFCIGLLIVGTNDKTILPQIQLLYQNNKTK